MALFVLIEELFAMLSVVAASKVSEETEFAVTLYQKEVPAERSGENAASTVIEVAEAMAVTNLVWPLAMMASPTLNWPEKFELDPVTAVPELEMVPEPAV